MCGLVFVETTIPDMVRRFEFAHPGDSRAHGECFPDLERCAEPELSDHHGEESLGRLSKPLSSHSTIQWSEPTHFARMWITSYR